MGQELESRRGIERLLLIVNVFGVTKLGVKLEPVEQFRNTTAEVMEMAAEVGGAVTQHIFEAGTRGRNKAGKIK
jgi:hypothetical protein